MSIVAPLNLTISEAQFQQTVIAVARLHGWMVHHSRPAMVRQGRWATPLTGHPGLPDLILARGGTVILAELKRHGGRVSPLQAAWLTALGAHGRLWTPNQWPAIVAELREGPTP